MFKMQRNVLLKSLNNSDTWNIKMKQKTIKNVLFIEKMIFKKCIFIETKICD